MTKPKAIRDPRIVSEIRAIVERGGAGFAAIIGPEGPHALLWAEMIAVRADDESPSRADLVRAAKILQAEVSRIRKGEERTRKGRQTDLRAALFAAFDAGRSRNDVIREHAAREEERRAPWASESTIKRIYAEWKRRPYRTIRAGGKG